ncbi:MAG TPA: DUF177 domain-containing protein [Sphingobacteriaceae bacterium]|nr:DUF177 domain-containing protein [Sphingobacteriaceae bacterium]
MKFLKQYSIPFTGLKNNRHVFDFEIDKRFFDEFEYSIVKNGELKVMVELDKRETMMILNFNIEGSIMLDCNFCLNNYPEKTIIKERIIVKFEQEEMNETTEEILVLSKSDYELDIAPLLYEYINLAVPINSRCDNPGNESFCDKEMVSKIESLNSTEEIVEKNDPRWDILKKIKNN